MNPAALERFDRAANEIAGRFAACEFDRFLLAKHPRDPRHTPTIRAVTDGETCTDAVYYNLVAIPKADAFRQRRERLNLLLR